MPHPNDPNSLDSSSVIETRSERIWIDEDGIIHCQALEVNQTIEDAKENMEAVARLAQGTPRPVLVDLRRCKSTTRETREYYSSPDTARYQCAAAILVSNPISRLMGNFFLGLNRLHYPTRLFTSEPQALEWLRDFTPLEGEGKSKT